MVSSLSAMWETWVRYLGQKYTLEKEMATHSSILAWRIPWTEEPSRLQSMGSQRVRHDWATSLHFSLSLQIFSFSFKYSRISFITSWISKLKSPSIKEFHQPQKKKSAIFSNHKWLWYLAKLYVYLNRKILKKKIKQYSVDQKQLVSGVSC